MPSRPWRSATLVVLVTAIAAPACSSPTPQPNLAVRFTTPAGAYFHCMDAKVTRLGADGADGVRFDCVYEPDESLELVYGTDPVYGEDPPAAVIREIKVTSKQAAGPVVVFGRADQLAAEGLPECRPDGGNTALAPRAIAVEDGLLAYGSHGLGLLAPCGDAILAIGKPLNQ